MRDETRIESGHRPVTNILAQPGQVARLGATEAARQQALLRIGRPQEAVRQDGRRGDRRSG
ncbi:hypothetical protein ACLF3G_04140 [Falsiroseomonas sp. HC035]|uniref:hypothetical protein n=1 Tax=Falsiroseomonas sp. HC035 TaxID=3390999 RepID=UPI003D31390E